MDGTGKAGQVETKTRLKISVMHFVAAHQLLIIQYKFYLKHRIKGGEVFLRSPILLFGDLTIFKSKQYSLCLSVVAFVPLVKQC